jgi:hypothetical protein
MTFDLTSALASYRTRIERAAAAEAAIATTDDERIAAACAAEWIDLDVAATRLVIEQAVRYGTSHGVANAAARVMARILLGAMMNSRHPEAMVLFMQEIHTGMSELKDGLARGDFTAATDGIEDQRQTFRERLT